MNAAVAMAFAVMGVFAIFLANTGQMTSGPAFQGAIGDALAAVFSGIERWTGGVPEAVLGAGVLALAAVFVYATLRDPSRRPRRTPSEEAQHPVRTPR